MEPHPVPDDVEEAVWDEACRRDEIIRAMVTNSDGKRIGIAVATDAAARLGLSPSTV